MKKIIIVLLLSFVFFVAPKAKAEEILNFDQEVLINTDNSINITETIDYDFGDLEKHGIFRDITYEYKARGGNFSLRLDDIKVSDENGKAYPFEISQVASDKRIKIGDKDKLVTGRHTYIISYTVKRAISFLGEHDELYWNVTGDKWPVKIKQSKSTVVLPAKINEEDLHIECFTGVYGSTDNCVSKRNVYAGAGIVKEVVFIDDVLQAGKGFTIVVGLPKGIVVETSLLSKIFDIIKDNIILLLPLLVFFYMFNLWRKKGREEGGRGVIVAQFDAPDKLSPMGVGTLIDNRADNKDFSANILNLAIKGYLKIIKTEKGLVFKNPDYALVSSNSQEFLRKSEQAILNALFKDKYLEDDADKIRELRAIKDFSVDAKVVLLSDLKNIFYQDLATIKKDIKKELEEAGYYDLEAKKLSMKYIFIAFILFFIAVLLGKSFGTLFVLSVVISSIIILIFGILLTRRSKKGTLAKEHILGLKKYLEVAEKDRIDFHNAPEKNPEIFEKLLPYAMVLGVEKKWAKQFEDIYKDVQPNWYSSNDSRVFSAIGLANGMRSFSASTNTQASSSPSSASSGGSGFSGGGSGGGYGGGGGGSW